MHRFRRILVAVDIGKTGESADSLLSAPSREALHQALWLAGRNRAELTILTVVEGVASAKGLLGGDFDDTTRKAVAEAEQVLDELVQATDEKGVSASRQVVVGKPWVEIIREVLRGKHDLVVAGTRERARLGRMLFGSTGLKLLHHCPCPVWITRPVPEAIDGDRPLNVLVASDLSDVSLDALQLAVNFGQLTETRTRVLHAVEHDLDSRFWRAYLSEKVLEDYRRKLLNDAERSLHDQLAQTDYRTLPYGVVLQIVEGPADACILDAVEEHSIDLLVMGTVGRAGAKGVVMGNTAERLLPHLTCSVLAVKPQGFMSCVTLQDDRSS